MENTRHGRVPRAIKIPVSVNLLPAWVEEIDSRTTEESTRSDVIRSIIREWYENEVR